MMVTNLTRIKPLSWKRAKRAFLVTLSLVASFPKLNNFQRVLEVFSILVHGSLLRLVVRKADYLLGFSEKTRICKLDF